VRVALINEQNNSIFEVISMDQRMIRDLFYKQISDLTAKSMDSFDVQFSDRWI